MSFIHEKMVQDLYLAMTREIPPELTEFSFNLKRDPDKLLYIEITLQGDDDTKASIHCNNEVNPAVFTFRYQEGDNAPVLIHGVDSSTSVSELLSVEEQ